MRIETQSINSQTDEEIVSNKFITSETASIVVRSDFHSGGTMIYKFHQFSLRVPSYLCQMCRKY